MHEMVSVVGSVEDYIRAVGMGGPKFPRCMCTLFGVSVNNVRCYDVLVCVNWNITIVVDPGLNCMEHTHTCVCV